MGLSPSPAPLDTWGGFRVEEQPSSSQTQPGHLSCVCASCRCSPLSSPAKPGSSLSPPSRPNRPRGSSLALPFPPQPFWPLGTGVARGFLAAFDAAWMVRRWAAGTPPLEVLAER